MMKRIIMFLTIGLIACLSALGQTRNTAPVSEEGTDDVYKVVETMPEYPGGQEGLMKYLGTIKYPKYARENDLEGTVYIQFVIDKNGSITDAKIARSSGHGILDTAALNQILGMAKWAPGMQKGKPVRVQYVVPLKFKLGGDIPSQPAPESQPSPGRSPRSEPKRN